MTIHEGDGYKVDTEALRDDAAKWYEAGNTDFKLDALHNEVKPRVQTDFKITPDVGDFAKQANTVLERLDNLRAEGSKAFLTIKETLIRSANLYDATDDEIF